MSTVADDPKLEQQTAPVPESQEQVPPTPEPATPGSAPSAPAPSAPSGLSEEERPLTREEVVRPAVGALMTGIGFAFMVGGMFVGFAPRIYAALGAFASVGRRCRSRSAGAPSFHGRSA